MVARLALLIVLAASNADAFEIPMGEAVAKLAIGVAVDEWSTGWALRQGPDVSEVNVLGGSVEERVALQFAYVGLGALAVHEASKRDAKLGRWLLRVMVGAKFALAAWNVRQGLKARNR